MLIALLAFAAAAQPAAVAEVQRTGEAYGGCVAAAASRLAADLTDMDAIFAAALGACTREEEHAARSYQSYLRTVGVDASLEQVRTAMAAERPRLRQRLEGCIALQRTREAGTPGGTC